MVRRRSTKRASSKGTGKPKRFEPKDSKIKRWNKRSDIPLDEEDQFHTSRDEILLNGDHGDADDDEFDDEEVFALKGIPQSSDDEEAFEGDEDEMDEGMNNTSRKELSKVKSKSTTKQAVAKLASESEEDVDETWGKTRSAYYSSNAAHLDSDDEEANELEEKEALRLQAKARSVMTEDDFGIIEFAELSLEQLAQGETARERTPTDQSPPLPQDKQALIRHVEKTNPETLALARDWADAAGQLVALEQKRASEAPREASKDASLKTVHHQTLLTYVTTLAFYLYLRTSDKYARKPELLRLHPVFPRLLMLKQALGTLEMLDFDASDSDSEMEENIMDWRNSILDDDDNLSLLGERTGLDPDELEDLLRDADLSTLSKVPPKAKRRSKKKSDGLHDIDMEGSAEENFAPALEPPKKMRKISESPQVQFDLAEPVFASSSKTGTTSRTSAAGELDAFGEATSLEHADASDKVARRKTLRFHTSKIESTSARRQGARNAIGGDDDIPYRERRKEQEQRNLQEARAKTRRGEDLDDVEPEAPALVGKKRARETEQSEEGGTAEEDENGYYDLVSRQSKAKKEKKKADYEAMQDVLRPHFVDASVEGPRSLTRAILTNRGLTPHRSKSVRNPRVKKRQRFEKAKKKLSSQKAVYTGGDASKYGGETSGISRVVKSVKF